MVHPNAEGNHPPTVGGAGRASSPPAESRLDGDLIQAACSGHVIGRRVVYVPAVDSTNTLAHRLAAGGAPAGTVVLTDDQTAGRGRFGRSWHMRPGASIACSVVLRPPLPPTALSSVSMAAAVAAVEACRSVGVIARIKWPNDLVVGERKLGGIGCESALQGMKTQFVVVGIGLNVNDDFAEQPDLRRTATSLRLVTGRPVDRSAVLIRLLRELDGYAADSSDTRALATAWAARSATVGRAVVVHNATSGAVLCRGCAIRLEPDGALVVRLADGSARRFGYAEVTIRHVVVCCS